VDKRKRAPGHWLGARAVDKQERGPGHCPAARTVGKRKRAPGYCPGARAVDKLEHAPGYAVDKQARAIGQAHGLVRLLSCSILMMNSQHSCVTVTL
jgi:hypothetical protein